MRGLLCALVALAAAEDDWVGINAITLATKDMAAARLFYGSLGMNCTYGCGEGANWTTFGGADRDPRSYHVNLFPAPEGEVAPRQGWGRVVFYVKAPASVDALYARAVARGLVPEFAPEDADWGERYFQILDPSGHELAIAAPLPSSAAPAPPDSCHVADAAAGDLRGLLFIGLGLSRASSAFSANPGTVSRQTQFDFDALQDRDYEFLCGVNDDGWLVGGGEGGAASFNLPSPDSAHIEVFHLGSGDPARGGVNESEIRDAMASLVFPPLKIKPSYARYNDDSPPEFELRFAPEDNKDLYATYERVAELFKNRNREVDPDSKFHMSIARKAAFRSEDAKAAFLDAANARVGEWRKAYPDGVVLKPDPGDCASGKIDPVACERPGGLYLFLNRNDARVYFPPTL